MNKKKIELIIKNMELLIESLKLELKEHKEDNVIKIEDILKSSQIPVDTYEPDYYEER
jgi:hypothetical protein